MEGYVILLLKTFKRGDNDLILDAELGNEKFFRNTGLFGRNETPPGLWRNSARVITQNSTERRLFYVLRLMNEIN